MSHRFHMQNYTKEERPGTCGRPRRLWWNDGTMARSFWPLAVS